ncbi:PCMD domain-containing protein [Flavobacterium agricola]|uniref:PCMD domain-containing protein n=1 Tax=Flavobacterium agricola TaxID=2870839 RepID=A0ABY6M1Q2_9FLAO|nr:PCMD domain-containing protein [Flavobacterium agricola]UYW02497.1 PCMD domain-containing protein [Flavobacterium agricola]
MKQNLFLVGLVAPFLFTSCIKDEELDTDADIVEAYIPVQYLKTDPIITNTSVEFRVKSNVDLTQQAPLFEISPNATIDPPNGTVRDYTTSQISVVTAQDNRWKKIYTISFNVDELSTAYLFDHAELTDKDRYYRFYTIGGNGDKVYDWASGNSGYVTVAGNKTPFEYPTTVAEGRAGGFAAKMQTVYTSSFAAATGNPIAAGNLFLGSFKTNLFNTLKSTKFGLPYSGDLPKSVRLYYKYTAGSEVRDQDFRIVPGAVDTFDVYAILFESRAKDNFQYGDHDFKDSRNVAVARIPDELRIPTTEWREVEFPFEMVNGKTFDPTKEYVLAIVMSSSIDGAHFTGAIGSTLIVDELELIYN